MCVCKGVPKSVPKGVGKSVCNSVPMCDGKSVRTGVGDTVGNRDGRCGASRNSPKTASADSSA